MYWKVRGKSSEEKRTLLRKKMATCFSTRIPPSGKQFEIVSRWSHRYRDCGDLGHSESVHVRFGISHIRSVIWEFRVIEKFSRSERQHRRTPNQAKWSNAHNSVRLNCKFTPILLITMLTAHVDLFGQQSGPQNTVSKGNETCLIALLPLLVRQSRMASVILLAFDGKWWWLLAVAGISARIPL